MSPREHPTSDYEPAFTNRREALSAAIGLTAVVGLAEGVGAGNQMLAILASLVTGLSIAAGIYFHHEE